MVGDPYIGTAREVLPAGGSTRPAGDGAPDGRQGAPLGDGGVREGDGAPFRVLICDDHEVLRRGLRAVLLRATDLRVVADVGSATDALALAARLRPDVTVVGLGSWGPVVADLVRALSGLGVRVVLLGEPGAGSDLVDALQAGACGYVHTTVSPQRLVDGVRAVARGEVVLDAAATGELLHRLDDAPRQADGQRTSYSGVLTARQMAVSRLVAEGLTNAEIAARLDVSRATVKGHITVALRRLGLRDRTQLAIHFHRAAGDLQA
ncbi:response regulator transcription factor [Modestobacter marinus]|uniref:DNA-binding NarL/FixJ family response regulator n=1 Tax=Modestobacter marinus TaxID=477641 RepID=A0A846LT81_9ACTN|nr:response regulator transcription factor [Modestobacter marinus]NIH66669.1 DNA-binding NarL/FixJ family response regulator [Modestobacter marinus]GGL48170.1 DNA-binding response regulator [Modestobacter marinus]